MTDIALAHDCPADAPRYPDTGDGRPIDRSRTAVLLMAYGSVDSLDQVEAYYTHIRRGSPPPPELLEELLGRYRAIGGASPLSGHTERQRAAVEAELARRGQAVPVYAAMKHIDPFIADVVAGMARDGVTHLIAMALAPHFSTMSICAYCRAVDEARQGLPGPSYEIVRSWHAEPRFIEALASATAEGMLSLGRGADTHVVFTAHSLPARIVDLGDPYPEILLETSRLVATRLGLPAEQWSFAFQSAGRTAEPWLGPDLGDHLRRLAKAEVDSAVVCPVGFVADHLEVLYDIDMEAQATARRLGLTLVRARSMNDDPRFIAAIADVLERRLAGIAAASA